MRELEIRSNYDSLLCAKREFSARSEAMERSEEAEKVETAFRRPPTRFASYSSGRSSNEAAFLLQLMLRALGSNNLADCSDLCHRASSVGLKTVFDTGTSLVSLESLRQAVCIVLMGSNAPANHPRLMNELIKLRDRGGTVIVVNPVREVGLVKFGSPAFPLKSLVPGSDIASLFLQPIPGSDLALLVGMQKFLIESERIDLPFLQAHTENREETPAADWQNRTRTRVIGRRLANNVCI